MLAFRCRTCGEVHEGIPALGFDYPLPYLLVPESDRAVRVELRPDHCIIDDEQFFIRGALEIHVHEQDDTFVWHVWVSLSGANFARFRELYDRPTRAEEQERPWFGWLSSSLPGYRDTLLLKTNVLLRRPPILPSIDLEPTDHPLAVDQRNGITLGRAIEIVQRVLHPGERD